VDVVAAHEQAVSVAEVVALYTADAADQALLQRVSATAALPQGWRDHFRSRLREANG
jgi:MOSC domain-containing protein YiiM